MTATLNYGQRVYSMLHEAWVRVVEVTDGIWVRVMNSDTYETLPDEVNVRQIRF